MSYGERVARGHSRAGTTRFAGVVDPCRIPVGCFAPPRSRICHHVFAHGAIPSAVRWSSFRLTERGLQTRIDPPPCAHRARPHTHSRTGQARAFRSRPRDSDVETRPFGVAPHACGVTLRLIHAASRQCRASMPATPRCAVWLPIVQTWLAAPAARAFRRRSIPSTSRGLKAPSDVPTAR